EWSTCSEIRWSIGTGISKLLSKLLDIEIPAKISEAIRTEKDLNLSLNNYSYEVEYFGEGSKWISLKMH
ncbi:MAG: hypothetical protein ABI851_15935, partial [Saprospiraceae bacterium]